MHFWQKNPALFLERKINLSIILDKYLNLKICLFFKNNYKFFSKDKKIKLKYVLISKTKTKKKVFLKISNEIINFVNTQMESGLFLI